VGSEYAKYDGRRYNSLGGDRAETPNYYYKLTEDSPVMTVLESWLEFG
jgi:hypothetical protein